jgi:hypothetical protein
MKESLEAKFTISVRTDGTGTGQVVYNFIADRGLPDSGRTTTPSLRVHAYFNRTDASKAAPMPARRRLDGQDDIETSNTKKHEPSAREWTKEKKLAGQHCGICPKLEICSNSVVGTSRAQVFRHDYGPGSEERQ